MLVTGSTASKARLGGTLGHGSWVLFFFFLIFLKIHFCLEPSLHCCMWDQFPDQELNPRSPAVAAWCLTQWTTGKFLSWLLQREEWNGGEILWVKRGLKDMNFKNEAKLKPLLSREAHLVDKTRRKPDKCFCHSQGGGYCLVVEMGLAWRACSGLLRCYS